MAKKKILIGGREYNLPNPQGMLLKPAGKSPFLISGQNISAPGAPVNNLFSQFSFQLPYDCVLVYAHCSVDGSTSTGLDVRIPSVTLSLTQPRASNQGILAVGSFVNDLNFSSIEQYVIFVPPSPFFISASRTVAVSVLSRFAVASTIGDTFRTNLVMSFQ